ncbi:hypothetical protein BDP27DRAFT_1400421 [Rhodocollybia butyracea]|uniref:F-box domain-containing protein n=1 Tax=Rhodocollybia butyracea TaxID=206335 RepID=A0A9P5PVM8_9AGAR|nr:hypothetical protein BDP27DRAFT_1400421 [Rhodocollybia butyracea]
MSINSLPNELLAKIFRAGTELDTKTPNAPCLLTYSSVSSRWRTICHCSPELWTNIRIPFHTVDQDPVVWTRTWLERSKSCLFDLTIDLKWNVSMEITEAMSTLQPLHDVLRVLIPHIPRLRRLYFTATADPSQAEVILLPLRAANVDAPQLRDFYLRFSTTETYITILSVIPLTFRSAPRLERQNVRGAPIQFPFHGLTSLEVHHLLPDEVSFRDLALHSSTLEELTVTGLHPMTNAADLSNSKIVFPALRRLIVSFARRTFTPGTCVLALMSPPNLTYLKIGGMFIPDAASFPNPAILTNLHTLCLDGIAMQHPLREGILMNMFYLGLPSVKHLQLINTSPQSLFPETEATRKPLSRSRSGELRSRVNNIAGPLLVKEIDFRILAMNSADTVKLPFSPQSDPRPKSSNPYPHWPNLTTVTLDTIRAKDLLWLCELVASRPEIETVYLSHLAKRHLASSLAMWKGEKGVFAPLSVNLKIKNVTRRPAEVEKGDMEPIEWLKEHVKVLEFLREHTE